MSKEADTLVVHLSKANEDMTAGEYAMTLLFHSEVNVYTEREEGFDENGQPTEEMIKKTEYQWMYYSSGLPQ